MNRREFVHKTAFATIATALPWESPNDTYYVATNVEAVSLPTPEGKRLTFGWPVFAVSPETTAQLTFPVNTPTGPLRLRFSVGMDVREEKVIEVRSAKTDQLLGTIDARFAYTTELYEVLISADKAQLLRQEGIRLKLVTGKLPIWFRAPSSDTSYVGLQPHVLLDRSAMNPEKVFWQNLGSIRSIQSFSWMEGCVTDGLMDWWMQTKDPVAKKALETHFARFFDSQQRLVYENPRNDPADGTIYGIECPLPLAALARLQPNHPALNLLIDFVQKRVNESGELIQEMTPTTEGCYTLAYPMGVLAQQRNDLELARLALVQLKRRQELLVTPEIVYQRRYVNGKGYEFPNWGRGVVWYLLGTVRTLAALKPFENQLDKEAIASLQSMFRHTSQRVLAARSEQGCWHAFVGEPQTGVDTSATAGIAAALALATRMGWLPADTLRKLLPTKEALFRYLTPDGFMTGTCQGNKGGEALQRNGYRVMSQFAGGLLAQFLMALKS